MGAQSSHLPRSSTALPGRIGGRTAPLRSPPRPSSTCRDAAAPPDSVTQDTAAPAAPRTSLGRSSPSGWLAGEFAQEAKGVRPGRRDAAPCERGRPSTGGRQHGHGEQQQQQQPYSQARPPVSARPAPASSGPHSAGGGLSGLSALFVRFASLCASFHAAGFIWTVSPVVPAYRNAPPAASLPARPARPGKGADCPLSPPGLRASGHSGGIPGRARCLHGASRRLASPPPGWPAGLPASSACTVARKDSAIKSIDICQPGCAALALH